MFQTRRRLMAAALLTLTVVGAATGILAFRASAQDSTPRKKDAPAKPRPAVYALIRVLNSEPKMISDTRHSAASRSDALSYRKTQAALLTSRPVLQSALRRDKVKNLAIVKEKTEPARWLDQNIKVEMLDNTELLRISFGEGSPQVRAVLINAVVAAYMDDVVYAEQRERQERVRNLETAFNMAKAELKSKQGRLVRLRGHQPPKQRSKREELTMLRKALLRVRLEGVGAQARLDYRKNAARKDGKATLAKLEEEIAVFAAQEKLLKEDISSLEERENRILDAEKAKNDNLSSLQEQVKNEERFVSDLALKLRKEQVELLAAPRITLAQKAEALGRREK